MTEFWKIYNDRLAAENHLRKAKRLGGDGRIVIRKSRGEIIYIAVYLFSEKILKGNPTKENNEQINKSNDRIQKSS
jgi:hypothetical protein